MILRERETALVHGLLRRHPVVGIVGARQVGKTTLSKQVADSYKGPTARFDLEDPRDLARLSDPMLALEGLRGLIVLDEVQRLPDIFSVLRVLADRPDRPATFLILGSASPDLLRQTSDSLAGRVIYHELSGFRLDEVGQESMQRLWLRGSFPRAYLAETDEEGAEWRRALVDTFLERDMAQLGFRMSATTLRRFWTMLAHYHGQIWNASEFARSFGVSDAAVRRYLDALASAMVLRILQPWHENIAKRQVRSPKVYIADSGLLHTLLGLDTMNELLGHPKVGASWEGFAIEELIHRLRARPDQRWYWATHGGAELDLLVVQGARRFGFEVKRTSAPKVTPSMRVAMADLGLSEIVVVHAGQHAFPLAPNIRAVPLAKLDTDLQGDVPGQGSPADGHSG
ncbi:MAG: ATP-binding protein [Armatimonadetes bacterium]|nr:ATP-binding protein [Armatimonadota bacterium]